MLGLLLSGLNFGLNIAQTGYKHLQNKKAYQLEKDKLNFAKDQFTWQQKQADLTRAREDTAIQRRSEDLKKAGFNPYLTENMGANATTVSGGVSAGASYSPNTNFEKADYANAVINAMRNNEQLKKDKLETGMAQFEVDMQVTEKFRREYEALEQKEKAALTKEQRELVEKQKQKLQAEYDTIMHDLGIAKNWKIRTSDRLNSDVLTGWAAMGQAAEDNKNKYTESNIGKDEIGWSKEKSQWVYRDTMGTYHYVDKLDKAKEIQKIHREAIKSKAKEKKTNPKNININFGR